MDAVGPEGDYEPPKPGRRRWGGSVLAGESNGSLRMAARSFPRSGTWCCCAASSDWTAEPLGRFERP